MNAELLLVVVYVYLAIAVAFLGRRTHLRFWRSLRLALLITPVVAFAILFFGYEARARRKANKKNLPRQQAAQQ